MPASGQEFMCGPLSVEYMTIVSSAMPSSSSRSEQAAHELVVVDHRVVVLGLPAPRLPDALGLGVGAEVHVRGVEPDEERGVGLVLSLDEIDCGLVEFVVDGLHALLGERAGVLDALGAVAVGPGMEDAARAELLRNSGSLG